MSRTLHAAIGSCTALICAFVLCAPADAQWWQIGSGPRGGMRYRGPLLTIDIGGAAAEAPLGYPAPPHVHPGVPTPVPPWHYRHDLPQPSRSVAEQERFYHDLDRMHRYRTREERYGDDFRDRYATGDPFYHSYSRPMPPTVAPAPWPMVAAPVEQSSSVPGLSYEPTSGQRRSFVADAEVADLLRPAANRLINSLSRKRDGALWMKQLQPDRIVQAIDRAEFPGSLADLVEYYDGVAHNPRLVLIAESDGFKDTHRLLAQYVLLQSRFATGSYPTGEYEVFMGQAGPHPTEDGVVIESTPSISFPPVELNSPSEAAPPAAASVPAESFQYLPAPAGEPDPQR